MANLTEKIKRIEENGVAVVTGGGSQGLSFTIVNSNGNGKRVTITKELANQLSLEDKMYLIPNRYDSEIILSSVPMGNMSSSGKISGDGKKTCYSAALVNMLAETLKLDYTGITSLSFNNISFEDYEGTKVALIKIDADKYKVDSLAKEA